MLWTMRIFIIKGKVTTSFIIFEGTHHFISCPFLFKKSIFWILLAFTPLRDVNKKISGYFKDVNENPIKPINAFPFFLIDILKYRWFWNWLSGFNKVEQTRQKLCSNSAVLFPKGWTHLHLVCVVVSKMSVKLIRLLRKMQ